MRSLYKALLLLGIVTFFLPGNAKATHVMGSDITWDCIGKDSFEVTLTVYRDCTGVGLGQPNLNVGCDSGGSINTSPTVVSGSYNGGKDITPICNNNSSQCNNGSFPIGIEKHKVKYIVDLSNSNCCKVNFNYDRCCRSNKITTLGGAGNPNFYSESWFDRCKAPCDNAPDFSAEPTGVLCKGRSQVYTQGAVDVDTDSTGQLLDSLSYEFAEPLEGPNQPITYKGQLSFDKPLNFKGFPRKNLPPPFGLDLDKETGDLRFTPTKDQVSVLSLKVNEYRRVNGKMQKIGEIRRGVQFFVKKCPQNNIPSLTGMGCNNPKKVKEICEGELLKERFCTNDPDKKDTVEISWKQQNLPGGTFDTINSDPQYQDGELTYIPDVGDASPIPYSFSVTAEDDNCPVPGTNTQTFQVKVKPQPNAEVTIDNKLCGTYEFSAIEKRGAITTWQWSSPNSDLRSQRKKFRHTFAEPGTYPIELKVTARGCSRIIRDTVKVEPFLRVDLGNDTIVCKGSSVTLGGQPKDTNGMVTYTWHDSVTGKRNRTFSNLQKDTNIRVTIADTVCNFTDKVTIDVRKDPQIDLGSDPRICPDDTAVIAPRLLTSADSMKNPPWIYLDEGLQFGSYKWHINSLSNPAFSKNDTVELNQSPNTSRDYILQVADSFNCKSSDTLTLSTNPELNPKAVPAKICRGDTSVLSAINKENARPSMQYTWTNLRTKQTYNTRKVPVSPDSTTTYAIVVEETTKGVLCRDSATTTVEVKDLPEVTIKSSATLCAQSPRLNLADTLNPNKRFGGQWLSSDLPPNALNPSGAFNPKNRKLKDGQQYNVRFEWKQPVGTPEPRCTNVDSAKLTIRPLPNVDIGTDTILCSHDEPLKLNGTPATPGGNWSGPGANAQATSSITYDPGSTDVLPSNEDQTVNTIVYNYTEDSKFQCSAPDSIQVSVQRSPAPDFSNQEICITNKTLSLSSISSGSEWSSGTWIGGEVSNGNFNTPDAPGDYEARYEVSTNAPFTTCTVQDTINVNVQDTPTVKAATASGDKAFCETRTSVQLAGTPTGSAGQWSAIDPAARIDNGNVFNPAASIEGENTLAYDYRDPATGCLNSDTITLEVDPKPEVNIVRTDTSKCLGARYEVKAEYNNTSQVPTWQTVGRSDLEGFEDVSSDNKTIRAFYRPNEQQEKNEAFIVTAEAQNEGACPSTFDSVKININPIPKPGFSADNLGCPPFDVAFENQTTISEGGTIASYEWKLGAGKRSNAVNPKTVYENPGTYNVTLKATSKRDCEATITRKDYIEVSEKPEADFNANPILTTINAPKIDFTNLTEGENTPLQYKWNFGENNRFEANTSTLESPTHTYADTGSYTVKLAVTNDNGCSDSLIREDYVRVRPTVITYAPTAFSPNGDGKNDTYRVEARFFTSFEIQIFNRWGEQVYQSDNFETHGWDGTYEGQQAPSGVYTYVISATGMDGEDYTFSGTITLIR